MVENSIKKLLADSGLSKKEVDIYLAILELGQATILQIANKSSIKRSTIYDLIPHLTNMSFVIEIKKGKKTYYQAQNPNIALSVLRQRTSIFEQTMPELMAIFNSPVNKPKIMYFHGKAEVQKMYEDTLKSTTPLLNLTSIANLYSYFDREWVEDYIRRRTEANISTKIIAVDSPESRQWQQDADEKLRQIKLIKPEKSNFSADMHIYGNKVIIATYREDLFGIIIEDEYIASLQKMAFEMMWKLI